MEEIEEFLERERGSIEFDLDFFLVSSRISSSIDFGELGFELDRFRLGGELKGLGGITGGGDREIARVVLSILAFTFFVGPIGFIA